MPAKSKIYQLMEMALKKQRMEKEAEDEKEPDKQEMEDEENEDEEDEANETEDDGDNPSAALDKIDARFLKTIKMKLDDYKKEHMRLINVLENPTKKSLSAEAKRQKNELRSNIV